MSHLRLYLNRRALLVTLVALLLIGLGALLGPLAVAGPQVAHVTPSDGASGANPQEAIRVEFDQWVQPGSVAESVTLHPPTELDVQVEHHFWPPRSVALIRPRGGLRYGTSYRLAIGPARNLLGRPIERPIEVAFATLPYVRLASVAPADTATEVALRAPITVAFDAPVVPAAVIAAAANDPRQADALPQPLTLTPATRGVGRWLSPTLFGFYPEGGLRAATTYTATLHAGLTPDGRARLEQPRSWRFSTEAPLLLGVRPFDGAAEVPADAQVEVRLAPDVDIASATAHFTLRHAGGSPVAGSFQPAEGGFLFKPAAPLQRGARYEARLAPGVRTPTGAQLNPAPLAWSFTTMGDLAVAQVEPPPDTVEVLTGTHRISVRFNHPVVAVTTIDAQSRLPHPLSIDPPLPGAGRWLDTSTYVYSPTTPLAPSTLYRVQVAAGLTDQTGGALRQEYRWNFTTITPQVMASVPMPGALHAGPRDPIQLIFNQPMEPGGLARALQVTRDDSGAAVAGMISTAANVVTWTPATPLDRGASYTLLVARGVRAAQGSGALASDYRASFRVAPLPRIESSQPGQGDQAAPLDQGVRLVFSTPMDWASVEQQLAIEPRPTEIYTYAEESALSLYFPLQPETGYRLTIGAAAHDPYGVALGQDATIAFRTGPLPPALSLVGPYQIAAYNAYIPARVPLRVVNVASISFDLYRLDPSEAPRLLSDYEAWQAFMPGPAAIVRDGIFRPQELRNREQIAMLDAGTLDAGMYLIEVRGAGIVERQIMAVSPYALTLKRSADRLFVWAVDLASGKPAAGLPLSVAGSPPPREQPQPAPAPGPVDLGRTDAEGILHGSISLDPYGSLFVWSPSERFAFATTNWGEGINPWDFGLQAEYARNPIVGALYTDRPIYRPGQNVFIRGAVRATQSERYELPRREAALELTINDPNGSAVFSSTLPLSPFGTFNASLPLERGAMLGPYSMQAFVVDPQAGIDGSTAPAIYGSFNVAEYRKPAFEVTAAPNKPDLIQGEALEMRVSARYFSGGPLANTPVRWRLLAQPFVFSSESAPGFTFQDFEDASAWYRWDESGNAGSELVADGEARTDAQGNLTISLPSELGKDGRSRILTLDVEVTDVDGQVIAAQGRANVHAGAFYVGLRPESYVGQAGQPLSIALITLDPQGSPVANRAVELGFYKREWYSAREQGPDGQLYWTSRYSDTLVTTQPAATGADGRATATFTPPDGGTYRVVAEGRDDRGRTIKSAAFAWVYGGDVFWGVDSSNRIDLIADRQRYRPGETASILVPAPYAGMTALMTIERGGVIEHRLFTMQGATELLHVPITADHAPNIYVSVVLVKPAGAPASSGESAPATADMRVGLVNLPVATEQQELTVTVTPDRPTAGPRDQVTYTVKAADQSGRGVRAELSLALVDKAVLTLADDPNPTLTRAFYERRPLGVFTAQSIMALADRVALRLQPGSKGGGGGEPGGDSFVRSAFADTAYWNPALVTTDDGTANVTVTLPDNLTTWRITARGLTTDTRVGQGHADLVATRPLLARPTLPRFLTVGDQVTLPVVIHNSTPGPIDATVTLDLSGEEGQASPLRLKGPALQSAQVSAGGQAVLRWPVEAVAAGQATLRVGVDGGGHQDTVEQTLPVQRYMTPEVVASGGEVRDTPVVETLKLPPASGAITALQGELDLELLPSLAAGIERGLGYLEHFPYECTEQTVSRFLPNAVSYRLFAQLGMADPELKAALERNLATALQQLSRTQRLDGGWGWWGGSAPNDQSHPYLTTYVVQGLIEARRAGSSVDQQLLDRALDFLETSLDIPQAVQRGADDADALLDTRAYTLFILAEAGRPDRGRAIALFEERATLALDGRAHLLMALKALGGEDKRVRTLAGELMSTAILRAADAHWEERRANLWTMSSDTRTTALALQALVRADPANFLIPNAVRYLMALRDRGHWSSTQESAVTLMALSEYLAQSKELEADYTYRATLNGQTLAEGRIQRDNLTDSIDVVRPLTGAQGQPSTHPLTIEKQGAGRLYYTLRMRTYQDAAAVQPLDRGLGVQRDYIAVDTTTLSPTGQLIAQAAPGEVVQVRLTLTVPADVHYLAIEDMLPAGLEPLDASLNTVTEAAEAPAIGDGEYTIFIPTQTQMRDDRVALFATMLPKGTYRHTYLARAVTPGLFQTLPATAYQMYAPELFGRSAGALFTVTQP